APDPQALAQGTDLKQPAAPRLDILFDASQLRTVDAPSFDAGDLSTAATAAHAANQSAATMPGYSPVAGLAGTLIGLGIAKGIQSSAAKKQANEPFEPLR